MERVPSVEVLTQRLLESRAMNFRGKTPLHLSVEYGNFNAVEILFYTAYDVDIERIHLIKSRDLDGRNILHSCALCEDINAIHEIIFSAAADMDEDIINVEDLEGCTPVMLAIKNNNIGFIENAIEIFGSMIIATDKALEKAARCGESEILQTLLTNFEVSNLPEESNPNDDEGGSINLTRLKKNLILAGSENIKDNFEVLEVLFDFFWGGDESGEFTEVRMGGEKANLHRIFYSNERHDRDLDNNRYERKGTLKLRFI